MTLKNIFAAIVAVGLVCTWAACNKGEKAVAPPVPGNEFITTVELIATSTIDSSKADTAKWAKIDVYDTSAPDTSKAHLTLKANSAYNIRVLFLDETKNPVADITPEILERENYHLICFGIASGLNLTAKRTDHDNNNPPLEVGLTDLFTTGNASSGNLNVTLHHQPNVKNGDCDPGSIDADVNYTINVIN